MGSGSIPSCPCQRSHAGAAQLAAPGAQRFGGAWTFLDALDTVHAHLVHGGEVAASVAENSGHAPTSDLAATKTGARLSVSQHHTAWILRLAAGTRI